MKRSLKDRWIDIRANKVYKRLTNKFLVATIIFVIVITFVSKNNLIVWLKNEANITRQERVIEQYRQDIRRTDEKLKELTSNRDSLEKFAREQYYFQEKDEEVFLLVEPKK